MAETMSLTFAQQDRIAAQSSGGAGADEIARKTAHAHTNVDANANAKTGTSTITLTVPDMMCGGCMRKVEAALSAVPGVHAARANLSQKRVSIIPNRSVHDTDVLTIAVTDTLAKIGFSSGRVQLLSDAEVDARRTERDLMLRMAIAGFASANVMLLSVSVWSADYLGGDMTPAMRVLLHWIAALIALPTVAYSGQPFFRSAWRALKSWRINMDVPISLGVLLATAMSLYQTINDTVAKPQADAATGSVYFDAAVMLLFFLLIGRFLDHRMRARAAGAAANLLALQAKTANVLSEDGGLVRMAAENLRPGMRIRVATGERVGVDGKVSSGASEIDNSLITGESVPLPCKSGDDIFAGAINLGPAITVRAEKVGNHTVLSEIGRLMIAAEQTRGRYVRLADRAARVYAPGVHILGFATLVAWLMWGAGWQPALSAAIAVLIITCPCALALAVPAAQVAATARLYASGVLLKAADGLERLSECDTVVFDKTGTLTTGSLSVDKGDPNALSHLADAARLAANSDHPYSRALIEGARGAGLNIEVADGVVEHPGAGLSLATDAGEIRLGSGDHCNVPPEARHGFKQTFGDRPVIWFRPIGAPPVAFPMRETLRPDAVETIQALQAGGFHVEILSGDTAHAVRAINDELGIKDLSAAQMPAAKVERLRALAQMSRRVVMVGDGLNDAPSLAAAHASLAPASAADISQTAADAIYQSQSLGAVRETLLTARQTQRVALQNFAIALGYNAVFVPLAMAGFVTPLLAAIAMSASSIAVTANAIRLRNMA